VSGGKKDAGSFKHPGGQKTIKSPTFRNGIAMRISRRESR
jgi:hypothetical protein